MNQDRQVLRTNPELPFLKPQGKQGDFLGASGTVNTFGLGAAHVQLHLPVNFSDGFSIPHFQSRHFAPAQTPAKPAQFRQVS
jgi:hypothetical protein